MKTWTTLRPRMQARGYENGSNGAKSNESGDSYHFQAENEFIKPSLHPTRGVR